MLGSSAASAVALLTGAEVGGGVGADGCSSTDEGFLSAMYTGMSTVGI